MVAFRPLGARRFFAFVAATLSVGLGVACSVNVDDLFQSSGGTGGASSNGVTSSTHGSTTTQTSVTNGSTMVTSTTGPGQTTTHASVQVSSSTGPQSPTVDCGATAGTCEISKGGCCYDSPGQTGQCAINNNCPGIETQIKCQFPSDCNGDICCAKRNNSQSPYDIVECDQQCDLPARYLCDPLNPSCPVYTDGQGNQIPTTCQPSTLLPQGYYICSF